MTTYKGIALSGKNRSGKDTAANGLAAIDSRFKRVGFADSLKRMAATGLGLDATFFFSEPNKIKHRRFLIEFGKAYRTFDPDFWVNKMLASVQGGTYPVVSDLRFMNEADALKKAGYLLVRLAPSDKTILARGGEILDDPSETELNYYPGFNLTIDTGKHSPEETASLIATAFGKLPDEALYGQKFRPGDRVRIIGGVYSREPLRGVVTEVVKNEYRMLSGPLAPMVKVRLDTPFGGKPTYQMRPNQLELE